MSTSYSANQYENAFVPNCLQNWEVPMKHRESSWKLKEHSKELFAQNPRDPQGFTEIIASDRGHIIEGVPRSKNNPWGNYVGTWDLPKKIPGNCARVHTARAGHAVDKLQREATDAQQVLSGKTKNTSRKANNEPEFPVPAKQATMSPAPGSHCGEQTMRSPVPMTPPPGLAHSPTGLPSDRKEGTPPVRSPQVGQCDEVVAL